MQTTTDEQDREAIEAINRARAASGPSRWQPTEEPAPSPRPAGMTIRRPVWVSRAILRLRLLLRRLTGVDEIIEQANAERMALETRLVKAMQMNEHLARAMLGLTQITAGLRSDLDAHAKAIASLAQADHRRAVQEEQSQPSTSTSPTARSASGSPGT